MSNSSQFARRYAGKGGGYISTWEAYFKINNSIQIIDAHFHLNYLTNLKENLENSINTGVLSGIVAGVWLEDTLQNVALTQDKIHSNRLCAVLKEEQSSEGKITHTNIKNNIFLCFLAHGLHPINVHKLWLFPDGTENIDRISKDISLFHDILDEHSHKIWAIGEAGFDLSQEIVKHQNCVGISKAQILELQNIAFEACAKIAEKNQLPLILHLRSTPWDFCMRKLIWAKDLGVKNIMIHCYSGPPEDMKKLADLGVYCSFGGVTTREKAVRNREAFIKCSSRFRMLETDSPDMPPEIPGLEKLTVNEPANLRKIAKILSEYLNISDIELIKMSNENILRFLNIF